MKKGDWARDIVNELCKEYGLSIQNIGTGIEEKELAKWNKAKKEEDDVF